MRADKDYHQPREFILSMQRRERKRNWTDVTYCYNFVVLFTASVRQDGDY